jgi:hypothetical protein
MFRNDAAFGEQRRVDPCRRIDRRALGDELLTAVREAGASSHDRRRLVAPLKAALADGRAEIRRRFEASGDGAAVMRETGRIARAMRAALKPDGVHIAQSNGEAAGQEVFHYHMHIYPHWTSQRGLDQSDAGKDRMAQSLKAALASV